MRPCRRSEAFLRERYRGRATLAGVALVLAGALATSGGAGAQPRNGKLLLTGGVATIDGAAGGGLVPWAVTGSHATAGQWGATVHATALKTEDYAFATSGAAFTWDDRIEVSVAKQVLDTKNNLAPLGLPGLALKQDILGFKWRLAGEAVLDADTWWPQVAVGLLHKRSDPGALGPTLFGPLGAKRRGTELYVSATKLFLAPGVLVNATLRATGANQNGLLGFGGAAGSGRRVHPEVSVAWLLRRDLAIGVEARAKPDALRASVLGEGALAEDDWFDAFVAWAPDKRVSVTAAAVHLGRIAPGVQPRRQAGAYLSVQLAF
jgi:hypothetical protein